MIDSMGPQADGGRFPIKRAVVEVLMAVIAPAFPGFEEHAAGAAGGHSFSASDRAGFSTPGGSTLYRAYLHTNAGPAGQRTGELHPVPMSLPQSPDFAPEAFPVLCQKSLYQSIRGRVVQVFGDSPCQPALPASHSRGGCAAGARRAEEHPQSRPSHYGPHDHRHEDAHARRLSSRSGPLHRQGLCYH